MSIALRPIGHVLDKLRFTGTRDGTQHKCTCPAHEDGTESLSVKECDDGKVLIHCFAGCDTQSILSVIGMTFADLSPDGAAYTNGNQKPLVAPVPQGVSKPKKERARAELGTIVATYDYVDELGTLLYQATRHDPKDFRQRQPDGKGGWVWSITTPPVRKVLYRLPRLVRADPIEWVYFVEGEKDANNLASLGAIATCNAMGAGKWDAEYTKTLTGRRVCILPDNDVPGQSHAAKVMVALRSKATEVIVLNLPGLSDKEDVSDWIERGGTLAELQRLTQEVAAVPTQTQPTQAPTPTPAPTFTEYSDLATAEPSTWFDKPHDTDMGNAQRMYTFTKDRVLYVPHFNKWYTWAGTHFQEDNKFRVLAMAKQTVGHIYTELAQIHDNERRKKQLSWIVQSESRPRLEAMIALLRSEPGVSVCPDSLDQYPMLLPVKNGCIDLQTGDLLPADPAHRLTMCVDVEYDPSAECPLWENFLIRIMGGDLELVSFIQRLAGHALTGDATGKYMVFMWGPKGNNGKSTLVETLMKLLGPYAMKSPTEMIMAKSYRGGVPNDVARLRGVRFTVTNEVDEGMTLSESVIKDLTGYDTLTARFMRGEFFDFTPSHKLWMYGNHKPEIRGTDPAIWDRVKLIPFEVEIPKNERDPHLLDKLVLELPGILAWAVKGCLAWQRVGINAPEVVNIATSEYRAEQDMMGQFLDDCCEVGKNYEIGAGTIYQAYEAWCKEMGIKPDTGTKFGSELGRRGYKTIRTANIRSRQGLRLNSQGMRLLGDVEIKSHWSDDK